jgi:CubicO group peptidase (beta-lactamase class C family)
MENIIMREKRIIGCVMLIAFFSIILTSCLREDPLKLPFLSFTPANLGDGWEIATPEEVGIDSDALKEVFRYVHKDNNHWQIRSLLVFRNNKLVAESYMKDRNDQTNLHPIWSNTKQVIGILTGMAIDRNLISLEDRISDFFPNAPSDKREITIEDLLLMKSGINYDNDGYFGGDALKAREALSNTLDYIFGLGLHAPIGTYRYKNSDPHLLSAIIQEVVGKTTRDWAQEVLFDKIGITRLEWRTYRRDGITLGGFGILTTPREMGKIGQLVLNNGMWNGEQIVSKDWIDEMTTPRIPPNVTRTTDIAFGYQWWIEIERNIIFMWGRGGQFVFINKDKNLIVVMTGETNTAGDHNFSVFQALSIYDRINSITN